MSLCQYQYTDNDYGLEDGGFGAIDVNGGGGRNNLSGYCGGDYHSQIGPFHDT